jgi:hypothetical protein
MRIVIQKYRNIFGFDAKTIYICLSIYLIKKHDN